FCWSIDMAAAGRVRSEDQFQCSICLDVFTDPVTIPCGHNFCKSCISENWRVNVPYRCPMCPEVLPGVSDLLLMCRKHHKPLELFCKTDHTCICHHCTYSDHKGHDVTPLKDQYEEQKPEVKKTKAEIQQMVQERRLKIQEIQRSVEVSKNAADRENAEGVEVFTALMESVQREICELKKRSTEVEQLSGSEDHLHFVQRFTCVKAAPSMKTWTKVSVRPPSYEGTVDRAVSELENKLRKDKKKEAEADLKRVQQYEVNLTLDPDTAHPKLILSDDGKQVHTGDERRNLPDKPQRFTDSLSILAKQSFSSGRFDFEVQVKGKTDWALGVVRRSINRKEVILPSPQSGYWTIGLINGSQYYACAGPSVPLSVKSGLQKVGVFVAYEEGLVSFYDVGSSVLIYSFIGCCFSDKLLPFFGPCPNAGGSNSAPLIITPVRH
uniref:Uncharacterized protein n=1 Tax=Sphaeramia orbicularis TaxID=375764 RepID=A0A672Y5T7_9TELE